jgi:hypothetical protein
LKAPGIKLLKLKDDKPLLNFAFKFNLRRYTSVLATLHPSEIRRLFTAMVGRCRLTVSTPVL